MYGVIDLEELGYSLVVIGFFFAHSLYFRVGRSEGVGEFLYISHMLLVVSSYEMIFNGKTNLGCLIIPLLTWLVILQHLFK